MHWNNLKKNITRTLTLNPLAMKTLTIQLNSHFLSHLIKKNKTTKKPNKNHVKTARFTKVETIIALTFKLNRNYMPVSIVDCVKNVYFPCIYRKRARERDLYRKWLSIIWPFFITNHSMLVYGTVWYGIFSHPCVYCTQCSTHTIAMQAHLFKHFRKWLRKLNWKSVAIYQIDWSF